MRRPIVAKWSKVSKGDRVELRGREYEVVKIKAKGSSAKVTVRGAGSVFESKVQLLDRVKIITVPLLDKRGAQQRWAKPGEVKIDEPEGLPVGDSTITKPPGKPSGDPWETHRDKVERRLDSLLGAHLVGESTGEDAGYYVPPVDISTVAAHVALFHGVDPSEYGVDDMLELHGHEHESALKGRALKVNHWHSETRPVVK